MKRGWLWLIGAGVASVAVTIALQAEEKQPPKKPAPAAQAAPATLAPASAAAAQTKPDKIAFTFSDETQMKDFAQMWQQRQGILTRMAVLQDYFNMEQGGLGELNKQLLSKFNLDVNKGYTLDTDHKVLLERETPPAGQAQAAAKPGQAQLQPVKPASTP